MDSSGLTGALDEITQVVDRTMEDVPGVLESSVAKSWTEMLDFLSTYSEACIVFCVALGLVFAWNGRFMVKPSVFALGALPGALGCFLTTHTILEGWKPQLIVSIVAAIVGGLLLGGLVVSLLYDLGVFLLGSALGTLVASLLHVFFLFKISPSQPNTPFFFGAIFLGLLFGLLCLSYRNIMLPLSTALLGAFVSVRGIAYFVGHYPDPVDFDESQPVFWRIIFVSAVLGLGALGFYSQMKGGRPRRPKPETGEEESLLVRHEQNRHWWQIGSSPVGNASGTAPTGNNVFESIRSQKPDQLREGNNGHLHVQMQRIWDEWKQAQLDQKR